MPGIDQTLDSKALTKMPSIGQHIGTEEEEDEKEKERNGAAKTATALPVLIIGCALRGTRSRKDSTKGREHGLEKRERGCNSAENIVYLGVACGKRGKGELSNSCRL